MVANLFQSRFVARQKFVEFLRISTKNSAE